MEFIKNFPGNRKIVFEGFVYALDKRKGDTSNGKSVPVARLTKVRIRGIANRY